MQEHANATVPLNALFADLDAELASTRRLLEPFPDDKADWRPHEKSMSAGGLAAHIASIPELGRVIAEEAEWDVARTPYSPPEARTAKELLELFDGAAEGVREAVAKLTPESLTQTWSMRDGETVYFEGPRGILLRQFLVSHTAHHRGQLTVYYRLLGIPVPGVYGPTADGM